jgi:hypothetical protein
MPDALYSIASKALPLPLHGLENAVSADVNRLQNAATISGFVAVDSPDVAGGGEQW